MYDEIRAAAASADRGQRRLRRLVAAALNGEEPRNVSAIARAAGITTQTAYRWAAEANPDRDPYRDPAAAIDDALLVLLELGAGPYGTLMAALRSRVDPKAKARRVRLGAGNLPGSMAEATDEQRSTLSAGLLAATNVLKGETE